MSKSPMVSVDLLRSNALAASRASFGWRRNRVSDIVGRARAFEEWLKPFTLCRVDYPCWLAAKRALDMATEDSRFDRHARRAQPYDTRTILRRAEAYRGFLAEVA